MPYIRRPHPVHQTQQWPTCGEQGATCTPRLSQCGTTDWTLRPLLPNVVGPGAFANPDFLEVGYSPRAPKGRTQSALEQRSMFTMWALLPGPLILSADLRPNAASGGIDADAFVTLTNTEVIAVNQDSLALPMEIVYNSSDGGQQVWRKKLSAHNTDAVCFFNRGNDTKAPLPSPPIFSTMTVDFKALGYASKETVAVRDLWAKTSLGLFTGSFSASVSLREAKIYTFVRK